jgi:hypothetical protein
MEVNIQSHFITLLKTYAIFTKATSTSAGTQSSRFQRTVLFLEEKKRFWRKKILAPRPPPALHRLSTKTEKERAERERERGE